jgi:hypothetical protein
LFPLNLYVWCVYYVECLSSALVWKQPWFQFLPRGGQKRYCIDCTSSLLDRVDCNLLLCVHYSTCTKCSIDFYEGLCSNHYLCTQLDHAHHVHLCFVCRRIFDLVRTGWFASVLPWTNKSLHMFVGPPELAC